MRRLLALMLLAAPAAHAARPLSTEDATYLEDKACQLEAWVDRARDATAAWMAPACNFGLGVEWQAGIARARVAGATRLSESYLQAKTAFGSLSERGWSIGAVAGIARHALEEDASRWQNPYLVIPLSWIVGDGRTTIHANAGWGHEHAVRRDLATWALAVERTASDRLTLLAETYGDERGNPYWRVGGRYAVSTHFDVDLSYVTRSTDSRAARFFSIGIFVQTRPFLP